MAAQGYGRPGPEGRRHRQLGRMANRRQLAEAGVALFHKVLDVVGRRIGDVEAVGDLPQALNPATGAGQ